MSSLLFLKTKIKNSGRKNALEKKIKSNQKQVDALQAEVDKAQAEYDALYSEFQTVYNAYCFRLKAMYMSGSCNIFTALLTCKDISSFLTRYEMIKTVSKSDSALLKEVNSKMAEVTNKRTALQIKKRHMIRKSLSLILRKNSFHQSKKVLNKTVIQ